MNLSIKKLQKELKTIKKKIKKTKLELNRRDGRVFEDSDDLEEATELLLPEKYVKKSKLKKRANVIANLPILLIYEDKVELCQRKKK